MSVYLKTCKSACSMTTARPSPKLTFCCFSAVSGDNNPVHLNAEYAETPSSNPHCPRHADGQLHLPPSLGTRLPGEGTIFLSNSCKFKAPVRIGDTVTARCTVSVIDVGVEARHLQDRVLWAWRYPGAGR